MIETLPAPPAAHRRPAIDGATALLLAAGLAVEAALIAGLAWPLRIWQPPDAITDPEPLSQMLGRSPAGLGRFLATLIIWGAGYLAALALCRRPLPRAGRLALIAFPVLFVLTLAPTWPAGSKDLLHYVMEGRTLAVHGENPLIVPPAELPGDPMFWILSSWQWEPSRYGPVWALVAAVPAWLVGDSLTLALLGFKAIAAGAFLATCALTYATARRQRPDAALAAYTFIAWNPLFLFESGANGHNDTLMLAFTALALYLAARRDWPLAFPALTAAILVKYICGLLGPILLIWAWRETGHLPAGRRRIALGLGLSAWLVLASYAVFWDGPQILAALRGAAGDALNSPGWMLREGLERAGVREGAAALIVGAPLAAIFLAAYGLAARAVWRRPWPSTFLAAGLGVLAAYLLAVSWWFWPWYVTWLLPVAALVASPLVRRLVLTWSLGALAAYIVIAYRPFFWGEPSDDRMPFWVTVTVFVPLLAAALFALLRRRPRNSPSAPAHPAPPMHHPAL